LKYWRFLFGDPGYCGYPFTRGMYPVGKTGKGKKQNLQMVQLGTMSIGDRALLYCTSSYTGHRQRVVGVGEIESVVNVRPNEWHINYHFWQFTHEVPWKQMLMIATASDEVKLNRCKYMWIIEVEPESFQKVVQAGGLTPQSGHGRALPPTPGPRSPSGMF